MPNRFINVRYSEDSDSWSIEADTQSIKDFWKEAQVAGQALGSPAEFMEMIHRAMGGYGSAVGRIPPEVLERMRREAQAYANPPEEPQKSDTAESE